MATKAASSTKKSPVKKKPATSKKAVPASAPASAKKSPLKKRISSLPLGEVSFWRTVAAELVGTFLLAAGVIAGLGQPIYVLFVLVGIVLIVGGISGAHLNPAITIAALVTRKIDYIKAIFYILAQAAGAALAFVVLSAFLSGSAPVDPSAALYGQAAATLLSANPLTEGKEWFVFYSELVGTAILAFAVAHALRAKQIVEAALSVGTGIFVALLFAVTAASYVGASAILNPAVAISLQALSFEVWPLVVYILGPIVGGILGFALYEVLKGKEKA